jgi:hypothetical protein
MNHVSASVRTKPSELSDRLLALSIEVLSFVANDKIERQARQWLSGVPWIVHDGHWTAARSMALELALITPSLLGVKAFDRLARANQRRSPDENAALSLMRGAVSRVARISGSRFEDLATGDVRTLLPSGPSETVGDGAVFGRFAMTGDSSVIATGMLLQLDQEALAVALGFARPDRRGLSNPVRCAEAVYRNIARRGMSATPAREREPELPFDRARDPLDALAADLAALDRDPGADELAQAKEFVGVGPLLKVLISVGIARRGDAPRLAKAYRWIAGALIEFMAVRESYGSALFSLDRAGAEIDAAVARGQCQFETKALFNELRERARLASHTAERPSGDLDKLMQRIRALREKTVDQGCTEQEAMAAAEKVAELLDRYGLSLSELDLRKQSCEGIGVETGRKRRGPIDDCMGTIARFFDCRVWGETADDGTLRYVFFGLPGDVQAAVYLHDLVAATFTTETGTFQREKFYRSLDSGQRRSATNSFQVGLAQGIIDKLNASRKARDSATSGSAGRALVPVKQSIIDEELQRLGLSLRRVSSSRRTVISDAFDAGKKAGKKFEYRQGIQAGS